MSAKIVSISRGLILDMPEIERLWFFPDGSEYLRYSPHFHVIHPGGFRQNLPLCAMFVIVLEGKLSVKAFDGFTTHKIEVRDQVWYMRGQDNRVPNIYAKTVQRMRYNPLPMSRRLERY